MFLLAAALLRCLLFCFFRRFPGRFLLCRLLFCGFLFCGLPGCFFLSRLLSCRLFRRLLLGGGLAATASSGGSGGSGCGRRRSGHYRLTQCRFGQASFFLLLFFLFEIFFERFAVGAAVAEFFFFITTV